MHLANPTPVERIGEYDGQKYVIPAKDYLEVPEAAGLHIAFKLRRVGIVVAGFGAEPDELEILALRSWIQGLEGNLRYHEKLNTDLKGRNMNTIPDSPAVEEAHRWLPKCRARLAEIEKKLVEKQSSADEEAMGGKAEVPSLDGIDDIDKLRELAGELGINVDGRWGVPKLKEEIEKVAAEAAETLRQESKGEED